MKLITLNTWGGRIKEPFLEFIRGHQDVDIFCFQEVYENAEEIMAEAYPYDMFNQFSDIQSLLPGHQGYFRPSLLGVYGQAIFISKEAQILGEGDILIHSSESVAVTDGHHPRNMQWIKFKFLDRTYTVMNVHGLWNGMGKDDTPSRVAQSNVISEFMKNAEGEKILCGDFNLNPETESMRILENGMRNLVKDYSITSTRTSFYEKPGKFADYILVTPDVEVMDFKVLPDEVSDHAALFLEV